VTNALAVRVAGSRPASPRPRLAAAAQREFAAIAIGTDNLGAGKATGTA